MSPRTASAIDDYYTVGGKDDVERWMNQIEAPGIEALRRVWQSLGQTGQWGLSRKDKEILGAYICLHMLRVPVARASYDDFLSRTASTFVIRALDAFGPEVAEELATIEMPQDQISAASQELHDMLQNGEARLAWSSGPSLSPLQSLCRWSRKVHRDGHEKCSGLGGQPTIAPPPLSFCWST